MMKKMLILSAISLILLGSNVPVRADLAPPPKPSPQKGKVVMNTALEVVPDPKAYDARLQIPKARLGEWREALASEDGGDTATRGIAYSSTRTILAGLFLFMSLSLGGVWLARSQQSRSQKVVAAVMLCTAVIGATAILTQANAGPPPSYRWRSLPQNLNAGRSTQGPLNIEIMDEDNGIKLILPLKAVDTSDKKTGE